MLSITVIESFTHPIKVEKGITVKDILEQNIASKPDEVHLNGAVVDYQIILEEGDVLEFIINGSTENELDDDTNDPDDEDPDAPDDSGT